MSKGNIFRRISKNWILGTLEDLQEWQCQLGGWEGPQWEEVRKLIKRLRTLELKHLDVDDVIYMATDWFPEAVVDEAEDGEITIHTRTQVGPQGKLEAFPET